MTASKAEYDSAALLLKEVWYAAEFLDETTRDIDWTSIQVAAAQISPSDSEGVLVGAAQALWTGRAVPGSHYVDALNHLDSQRWEIFVQALRIRRGQYQNA